MKMIAATKSAIHSKPALNITSVLRNMMISVSWILRKVSRWILLHILQIYAACLFLLLCSRGYLNVPNSPQQNSFLQMLSVQCILQSPNIQDDLSEEAVKMMENKELIAHIRKNILVDLSFEEEFMEDPDGKRAWMRVGPRLTTKPKTAISSGWDPSSGGAFTSKLLVPHLLAKPNVTYYKKFFEAGALDGVFHSTTYYLEKTLGWQGLLAEANPRKIPEVFDSGRSTMFAPVCLSPEVQPCLGRYAFIHQAEVQKKLPNGVFWYGGLQEPHSFLQTVPEGWRVSSYPVYCYPLYSLLVAANLTKLDFLSLDLEGTEVHVLATLPWQKVDFKVIRLDLHDNDDNSDLAVKLLTAQGYMYHKDLMTNPFATKRDSHIFSKFT